MRVPAIAFAALLLATGCGTQDGLHVEGSTSIPRSSTTPPTSSGSTTTGRSGRACHQRAGCVVRTVDIGSPGAIGYDAGTLWVAAQPHPGLFGTLIRISSASGRRTGSPVPLPASWTPYQLAVGMGQVWLAGSTAGGSSQLWEIDPSTGTASATVNLSGAVGGMVMSGGSIWLTEQVPGNSRLIRVDPSSAGITSTANLPGTPGALTVTGDLTRVLEPSTHQMLTVRSGGRVVRQDALPEHTGSEPSQITVTGGLVWEYDGVSAVALSETDGSLQFTQPVLPVAGGGAMAGGADALWVTGQRASAPQGVVARLNDTTGGQIGHLIVVGGQPSAICTGDGSVWVLDYRRGVLSQIAPGPG